MLFCCPLLRDPEAGRVAGVLAALVTIAMTYRLAVRWRGETAGLLAGSLLATTVGFFSLTQSLRPDPVFTFCMVWAFDAGSRLLVERLPDALNRAAVEFGIALGLGMLASGGIALAYPVLVLAFAVGLTGSRVTVRRLPWARAALAMAVILGLGIGARQFSILPGNGSWPAARTGLLVPWYGLLPLLLAGFFPWTVFLPAVSQRWFTNRAFALKRDPTAAVLVAAALLFFISLSAALPALAILTAEVWSDELESSPMPAWVEHGLAALIFLGIAALLILKLPGRMVVSVFVPLELGLAVFLLVGVWGMRQAAYAFGAILFIQGLLLSSLAPILRALTKNL